MKIVRMAACVVVAGLAACGFRGSSSMPGSAPLPAPALNLGADVRPICGSSTILGKHEESFSKGGCGISNPVRVYALGGVELSTPALVNCQTARATEKWVNASAKPAAARVDKRLSELKVAASYACRNRNHKKGGKLSEHAKGNAIDISGFTFTDGTYWSVLGDYHSQKSFFRPVHKEACGIFGTVLGPGSYLHDDHFHFDTASYSYGPYCK